MIFGKNVNKYYIKYAHYLILGIVALIFVDIYQLKIPEIIGSVIDNIDQNTLTMDLVNEYAKEMIIVVLIMFFGRFLWRICIFGNGARIESDLRAELFKKSELLSQTYYSDNKVGSIMALYTNDLQTIRQVFGSGTIMFIDALFLGILALIKMFRENFTLTIIGIIPLVCLAVSSVFIGRYMEKKFLERQEAYASLSDFAQESFSGLSVIKAFLKEAQELKRFSKINKKK